MTLALHLHLEHDEDLDQRARVQPQLGGGDHGPVAEVPQPAQLRRARHRRGGQEGRGRRAAQSQVSKQHQVVRQIKNMLECGMCKFFGGYPPRRRI